MWLLLIGQTVDCLINRTGRIQKLSRRSDFGPFSVLGSVNEEFETATEVERRFNVDSKTGRQTENSLSQKGRQTENSHRQKIIRQTVKQTESRHRQEGRQTNRRQTPQTSRQKVIRQIGKQRAQS